MVVAETRPGVSPEAPQSTPILFRDIVSDLQSAVTTTLPSQNPTPFVHEFVFSLQDISLKLEEKLYAAKRVHQVIAGDQFTKLPEAEQREWIYRFSEQAQREDPNILNYLLAYQNWGRTIAGTDRQRLTSGETSDILHYANGSRQKGRLRAEYPVLNRAKAVALPKLTSQDMTLQNTTLQEKIARNLGGLEPEETWRDFLERATFVVHGRDMLKVSDAADANPGKTVQVESTFLSVHGTIDRTEYLIPSVKYPEAYLYVAFTSGTASDLSDKLAEGSSTPVLGLSIPTEAFFLPENNIRELLTALRDK